VATASSNERLFIGEEDLFVTSIDASQIKTWEEFEYVLSVIIENRLLQVYQGHLDKEYQKKWKKLDQELLSYAEEPLAQEKKPEKQKAKKPKKKKVPKKQPKEAPAAKNILESIQEDPEKIAKV
jgi:hypothetical protein